MNEALLRLREDPFSNGSGGFYRPGTEEQAFEDARQPHPRTGPAGDDDVLIPYLQPPDSVKYAVTWCPLFDRESVAKKIADETSYPIEMVRPVLIRVLMRDRLLDPWPPYMVGGWKSDVMESVARLCDEVAELTSIKMATESRTCPHHLN